METKQKKRTELLLSEVLPSLTALLNEAPDFWTCGIDFIFHEGVINRIITKTEKSSKPLRGCKR